jgi:hypothetical protein
VVETLKGVTLILGTCTAFAIFVIEISGFSEEKGLFPGEKGLSKRKLLRVLIAIEILVLFILYAIA